jgi:hypothetical protein
MSEESAAAFRGAQVPPAYLTRDPVGQMGWYDPIVMTASYISEAFLSERLLHEARWAGKDAYPAHLEYSIELEGLLGFIQGHNQLSSFWPRLSSPRTQERDDALQEIRVARFLTAHGFPVSRWEPPGNGNLIGEFSVQALPAPEIFVEIKSPGWEGELTQEQRDAGRAKQEKYQNLEGGAVGPAQKIRMSMPKAYPKFLSTQPNLLVIADDLFVPLATWGDLPAEQALFLKSTILEGEAGYFTARNFENLGGVALFKVELPVGKGLQYEFLLYPNPIARTETALPAKFLETFPRSNIR